MIGQNINYLAKAHLNGFDKGNNLLMWLGFFMVTPVVLIGTNLSMYAFIYFFIYLNKTHQIDFKPRNFISSLIILFAIGILFSVTGTLFKGLGVDYFIRGLAVLFNYWYWCFLVILIINLRRKINFLNLSKGIFWGITFLVVYYYFLSGFLKALPAFRGLQQNTFSFLLICYVPFALYYISQTGTKIKLYIFSLIYVLAAFLSNSRTGSVLVLFNTVFFVFFYKKGIKLSYLLLSIFLLFVFFLIDVPVMLEGIVYNLNSRTHALLYGSKNVSETDVSFLVRLAVVNKGMQIFADHPISGIGLNNFASHDVRIDYNFKGAELIKHNDASIRHLSAHNSYISILAEAGLVGFVPFVSILIYNILSYIRLFAKWNALHLAFFLGFIGMCFHMYLISAILNVFAWFYIALVSAYILLTTASKFKSFK